jgi:hypothetical protein
VSSLQQAYEHLLATLLQQQDLLGPLAPAVTHFCKVSHSYWNGLLECYRIKDLPRTNTDLEQYFGSARPVQRPATGRKRASAGWVVRGAGRVVAAGASRLRQFCASDLRLTDEVTWRKLRQQLAYRHEARRGQLRLRRDPQTYLATLAQRLLTPRLPP